MKTLFVLLITLILLTNCKKSEPTENSNANDTLLNSDKLIASESGQALESNTKDTSFVVRIFPLDSLLEINYRKVIRDNSEQNRTVNIIDLNSKHWIFDSNGPQIESNSFIEKVDDSKYVISVYYDFYFSKNSKSGEINTIPKDVKIAKYILTLNQNEKSYKFEKDSLYWPNDHPFRLVDIEKTIEEYKQLKLVQFKLVQGNENNEVINKMFEIERKLLSSYISGCNSCYEYSDTIIHKFENGVLASDGDYLFELSSVFKILKENDR